MTDPYFSALPVGAMTPLDVRPTLAQPKRKCAVCRFTVLSRYTSGTVCAPCSEKAFIPPMPVRGSAAKSNRESSRVAPDINRAAEAQVVLAWLREHPEPCSSQDVATATGLPTLAVAQYLRRFVRTHDVEHAGKARTVRDGPVQLWRVRTQGAA